MTESKPATLDYTVVIPVYNSEKTVAGVIERTIAATAPITAIAIANDVTIAGVTRTVAPWASPRAMK